MEKGREAFEAGALEMKRRVVSAMGVWLKARRDAGPIQPEEIDGLIVDFEICPLPERPSPPTSAPPEGVPEIETDDLDPTRQYIPLPGGWEVQTRGRGSSYRLLDRKTGERRAILTNDPGFIENFVTRMALEVHAGWQAALAYVREGVEWKKGSLEEVGTTDRGYTIFREVNEVGGHRYWSDEIGGGVVAWDTCLVDAGTLRECLRIEEGTVTESSGCVFRDLNASPLEKE